jgi:hypothetical protein
MYKERKVIIVDCCDNCPFKGECKPWKDLTRSQRVNLSIGKSVKPFILKECPLPYGEDNAKPFGGL